MEYLDYYDEEGNYLGYDTRENVHKNGLWHNTVHCWLYNKEGEVFFQIRKNRGTLYTTASGHVSHGETIKDAFNREIKEEIGLNIDSSDATFVEIVPWKMDKVNKDGSITKDRAKANVYVDLYEGNYQDFHFDPEEVLGIGIVKASDALELFDKEDGKIQARFITEVNGEINIEEKSIGMDDFLVNDFETAKGKYGKILEIIINLTK